MKVPDKVHTTLVSFTQCVIFSFISLQLIPFGKELALLVLFRLLRRIFKQFRINKAGQLGGSTGFFMSYSGWLV